MQEATSSLCLVNVPLEMTRIQLKDKFFKQLIMDDKRIEFPKKLYNQDRETKIGFIHFMTVDEAILARIIINNADYRGIIAKFGRSESTRPYQNGAAPKSQSVENLNNDDHKCNYCGAVDSKFVCVGCCNMVTGTYYCSEDHQAIDWIRHKRECKEMPPLKDVAKSDQVPADAPNLIETGSECGSDVTKGKFFIKHIDRELKVGDKVFVTCVSTPRVIYVRPVDEDENYLKLLKDIESSSSKMVKRTERPEINDHVLALFRGSFSRAKIVDLFEMDGQGMNAKVFMVDYGDEINVKWQECRELNYRLRGIKTFVFKILLSGAKSGDGGFEEILDYLQVIHCNNEALEITEVSGNGQRMTLKRINGEIVNDEINKLVISKAATRPFISSIAPVLYNNLPLKKIEPGHDVQLHLVDCSRLLKDRVIACMPQDKFSTYLNLLTEIKVHSRVILPDVFKPTEKFQLVLAQHNGKWHRAAVMNLEMVNDELEVLLVDLLVEIKVNKKDIRKIPPPFTKELFSQLCRIDGLNDDNIHDYEKKIEPGTLSVAQVLISADDDVPILKF